GQEKQNPTPTHKTSKRYPIVNPPRLEENEIAMEITHECQTLCLPLTEETTYRFYLFFYTNVYFLRNLTVLYLLRIWTLYLDNATIYAYADKRRNKTTQTNYQRRKRTNQQKT